MAQVPWQGQALAALATALALGCAGCVALPAAPIVMAHAGALAPLILNHAGLIVASDAVQTAASLPTLAASTSAVRNGSGPGYDW